MLAWVALEQAVGMNVVELSDRILKATCHLVVIADNKAISAGTGVFVEGNELLTAAHVVFQRPGHVYPGDLMIRGYTGSVIQRPPLNFRTTTLSGLPPMLRPVVVDVAAAAFPTIPPHVEPLPLARDISPRGTEILIAGYTDEIPLPMDFDWSFELRNPDMTSALNYLDDLGRHFVRPPMVKRAMIGCVSELRINLPNAPTIVGASYVLDNDLTYGGSGGPVMNLKGELVGVLIRKATTSARELRIQSTEQGASVLQRIFSGAGLALSHHLVTSTRDVPYIQL